MKDKRMPMPLLVGTRRIAKERIGKKRPIIYTIALVVLFWTMFDSIMSYITPLLIQERGFSNSMIGIIIGSSSIIGALFDFLICKFLKNINFRRIFLIMFLICSLYPLLLWKSNTIGLYLFAMAVWGVYFDLYGFGIFNFVGRYTKSDDHSSSFGIVQVFRTLGGLLAPLIVGLVIVESVDWKAFSLGWLFLGIAFIFFIALIFLTRKSKPSLNNFSEQPRRKNLLVELHLWKKIGRKMIPVLFLTFFLFFIEAFFWTIGPLYAETVNIKQFGGIFIAAYVLPALIVGWYIGPLTKKIGKKRTAFLSLLIGSLILSSFAFLPSFFMVVPIVFVASCFISVSLPAINAAYADYISESPQVEGEIEGLEDSAFNIGYVIGPILAGVLSDVLSIPLAFSMLGVIGVISSLVLLFATSKKIVIDIKPSEL